MVPRRASTWWLGAVTAAAALAASAWVVRRQSRRVEREFPPKGRFATIDGARLHYLVYGKDDAPQTVVLLHGNGLLAEEFDISGLARQAAWHYRVIAIDRPGFGYSERPVDRAWGPEQQADLIHRLLMRLGVRSPVVLGHSWGANVALAMGLRHAQDIGSLVLASGYYTPSLRLDVPLASLPALPVVGTLMRHTLSPLMGRLLWPLITRRVFAPMPVTAAFKRRYPVWMSLRPSQLRASAAESARMIPTALSLRRRHGDLRVPTMIVAGADDRFLSTSWNSSRLIGRLPQGALRVIDDAGHMVHHTATSQVFAAIQQAAAMARALMDPASTREKVLPRQHESALG